MLSLTGQRARPPSRGAQRGLSLVELMVGVAIGLVVVAAAALLAASQLSENRRLLLEAQVQQDLRASGDLIAREIRRSGAPHTNELVLLLDADSPNAASPNGKFEVVASGQRRRLPWAVSTQELRYDYEPSDVNSLSNPDAQRFVVRRQVVNGVGVLRLRMGAATWQDLTDANVLDVTAFTVSVADATALPERMPCPRLCPDGSNRCWPQVLVREVSYRIEGRARSDATVQRAVDGKVRLRAEDVRFNHTNVLGLPALCP